jgi:predicted RNA-binding Zn-ribbon protein involved in translation (DUF1610 family)
MQGELRQTPFCTAVELIESWHCPKCGHKPEQHEKFIRGDPPEVADVRLLIFDCPLCGESVEFRAQTVH